MELTESGLHEFRELFHAAQKLEESIWMGDCTFFQYLRGLTTAKQPLARSRDSGFESTPFGQLTLAGKADHVRVNGIDRWLGGVHLCEGAPVWRWDHTAKTIRPS